MSEQPDSNTVSYGNRTSELAEETGRHWGHDGHDAPKTRCNPDSLPSSRQHTRTHLQATRAAHIALRCVFHLQKVAGLPQRTRKANYREGARVVRGRITSSGKLPRTTGHHCRQSQEEDSLGDCMAACTKRAE